MHDTPIKKWDSTGRKTVMFADASRHILLVALCLSVLALGCDSKETPEPSRATSTTDSRVYEGIIAAVGDSLTAGYGVDESQAYPAQLEAKLFSEGYFYRVVNSGVSGETSSGTLSRIDWVMSALKPDVVILETGANDGLRGIDPEVLKTNLDELVGALKKNNIQVILAGMQMLPNLGPEYTKQFAGVYPEVARKHTIPLIPFFLQGVAGEPGLNQADKIHPTAEGYARIVENIFPHVIEVLKKTKKKS